MTTSTQISRITATTKTQTGIRTYAVVTLLLLGVQFVLGMITNLFLSFPDTTAPDQLWAFARSQAVIFTHIIVGIALLVSAIVFLVRATRKNNRGWLASAVVGLVAIVVAIFGGVTFTTTQVDAYSLVMALGFIGAVLAYGWGLYANRG